MLCWKNSTIKALSVLFLTTFVSGCLGSTEPTIVVGTPVPKLDPRDEATCPDPGVRGNAVQALAENRLALADCRRRHANVVEQYNTIYGVAQEQ